jgi:hypothetical protein
MTTNVIIIKIYKLMNFNIKFILYSESIICLELFVFDFDLRDTINATPMYTYFMTQMPLASDPSAFNGLCLAGCKIEDAFI